MSERVALFGCAIDTLTMDQTVAAIDRRIRAGAPTQHCVVNVSKVVLMRDDQRLREIVRSCAIVNADGQGIVWAARLLGVKLPERVAGIDLFVALLALADLRGYSLYLFGAQEEVVADVARIVREAAPGLTVAGSHSGYFRDAGDEAAMIVEIRALRPDILVVAMPSPRKEYWLDNNLEGLGVPFAMGVGGTFDVIAGRTRRAPLWMQRAGLEWSYRFAQEPRRLWRRYLLGNLRFAALVAAELRDNGHSRGAS